MGRTQRASSQAERAAPTADAFAPSLLAALLAADRDAAERALAAALDAGLDGLSVIDELLAPTMWEVGRLWETEAITIADEHLATAIAHATLASVYPALVSAPPRSRGVVLLAGADGEQHMLGLRMVADVLEGAGFDVRNTAGALTPPALSAAVARHRPVLVGLAHTVGGADPLLASIRAVHAVAPACPVLLGGAAAAVIADVPRDGLGPIELCASARDALRAAERLTPAARA